MAIFFLFELYKFIVVLIEAKKPKISEEDEEAIKKKAIEEYLAKEKAEKEATAAASDASADSAASAAGDVVADSDAVADSAGAEDNT